MLRDELTYSRASGGRDSVAADEAVGIRRPDGKWKGLEATVGPAGHPNAGV